MQKENARWQSGAKDRCVSNGNYAPDYTPDWLDNLALLLAKHHSLGVDVARMSEPELYALYVFLRDLDGGDV